MSDLLKFGELLAEAQQPEFRSQEMITESTENARKWIDELFISVTKFGIKEFEKYATMTANKKEIVTTDGKFVITLSRGHGLIFRVSDSSNFYKSGTSPYYGFNVDDTQKLIDSFTTHFTAEKGDLLKTCAAMMKDFSSSECSSHDYPNRDASKFNPYSLSGIKAYSKALPKFTGNRDDLREIKLRTDDVVKMIVNGQVKGAVIGRSLSDDYYADAYNSPKGNAVNPIDIITDDLLGKSNKARVAFDVTKEGEIYVSVSPHRNLVYNLYLDQSKFSK